MPSSEGRRAYYDALAKQEPKIGKIPKYDVLKVQMSKPHSVTVMCANLNRANADACVSMAVMRQGVVDHFFVAISAGAYRDGDEWVGHKSDTEAF